MTYGNAYKAEQRNSVIAVLTQLLLGHIARMQCIDAAYCYRCRM